MKKPLILFFITSLLIILGGCSSKKSGRVKELVLAENKARIQFAGNQVDSLILDGDNIVYYYGVDDRDSNNVSLDDYNDQSNYSKIYTKYIFAKGSDSEHELMDAVKQEGYGIKVVYKSIATQDSVIIQLTREDLYDWDPRDLKSIAREYIELSIPTLNEMYPVQLDKATVLNGLRINGSSIVYDYLIDESILSMEDLMPYKESFIYNILNEEKEEIIEPYAKDAELYIQYVYTGSISGLTISFEFIPITHELLK